MMTITAALAQENGMAHTFRTGLERRNGQIGDADKFLAWVQGLAKELDLGRTSVLNNKNGFMANVQIHTSKGAFQLNHFPSQCGTLILHDLRVYNSLCDEGWAQKLESLAVEIATNAGYSTLLSTWIIDRPQLQEPVADMDDDEVEDYNLLKGWVEKTLHLSDKLGWKQIHTFVNERTKNTIGVFIKSLV